MKRRKIVFSWILFVIAVIPFFMLIMSIIWFAIAGYRVYSPDGIVFTRSYGMTAIMEFLADLFSFDRYGRFVMPVLLVSAVYQIIYLDWLR